MKNFILNFQALIFQIKNLFNTNKTKIKLIFFENMLRLQS